jgi:carbon-monoxide dehydrogenase iron sulfur subunit
MKRISVNVDTCSGCRRCELTCAFAHEKKFRPSVSRINVVKEDSWGFDFPILCVHCDDCPAMENCPSEALYRNAAGLVAVDEERCSGCGNCVKACRLAAIRLHPDKHTPLLCDLCGGKPQCIEKCPTSALVCTETAGSQSRREEVMKTTLRRWGMVA